MNLGYWAVGLAALAVLLYLVNALLNAEKL
ncbi:potassium-transporting ATPase subunit F [Massilia norwichensis]|jgi:F subunit of K+-transporting ATPase (Potass_KdpF)|uniref:Potassium-transporting ATPase subunit F n=1 Tax=Massilia norwichensis TaxID=1442366 RepID=A0ABT2A3V7_9BURK|nr:potassium-transporting ATPase subunit F [Massilia norwichensis]MCS0588877.1 potassium-transporting ATPase subunit F [Massilia norwichensis]